MTIKYFILTVHTLISLNLNQSINGASATRITVIGTAIVIKHHAAVRTDDNLFYYLYGKDDWDAKYKGKKVKVTGKLITLPHPVTKNPDPEDKIISQPRVGGWEYIKNAKWKLVKQKR